MITKAARKGQRLLVYALFLYLSGSVFGANADRNGMTTMEPPKFKIPPGIFTTHPRELEQLPSAAIADVTYDDFDVYVPYRSDEHDQFSWKLLKAVLSQTQENVIFSPFSVKLVLALLSEAAGNNTQTQKELIGTLTDIRTPDNLRGFYKKILTSLKKENPHYVLNLATKLYTDEFIEPQQRYAAMLQTFYDTDIERIKFADSQNAARTINAWCSNVTNGHLQQIVTPDKIQSSVMLLANAIYFNGLWRREFNATFDNEFFTLQKSKRVQFMEITDYFYHYDSKPLDAKILRLPYRGKKFSMFIVLPKAVNGIENLVKHLENDQLKNAQWMMEDMKVKVTVPKFKFEFQKELKDTLVQLGIRDIFTDDASLPGLARGADVARKLKVSNVFQKAGIDVNEKGTEAFASTVVEIENKFGGSTAIEEFNVNRPFIFFIEEEATGNIIFAGKVLDPIGV